MRFLKMNGAGNDFVVLDARRAGALPLTPEQARDIADRKSGVGCDQVIAIEHSMRGDAFMRIWNAEGGEVDACGNATRCVAWLLMAEGKADAVKIETAAGLLNASRAQHGLVTVDMNSPLLRWEEIPVAAKADTTTADISFGPFEGQMLAAPGLVNMGNPHAVFVVEDVEAFPCHIAGPAIENDPWFPLRVNVGFAQILKRDRIRLRVWERGAGLTRACGTGACAAVVALHRKGLISRKATVIADGGELQIDWREDDDKVAMTGPIQLEFSGVLPA
jgi:diaminopimelate epimerase